MTPVSFLEEKNMKQSVTVLLIGFILLNTMFSCTKKREGVNQPKDTLPITEQSIQPIDISSLSDKEIEWKSWESSPIQIETRRFRLDRMENTMDEKAINEEWDYEHSLYIEGNYPQLRGLANKPFQDQVNQELYNLLLQMNGYSEYQKLKSIDALFLKGYETDMEPIQSCYFTYTIPLISNSLISILFQTYYIIGSAGAYQATVSVQIDLKHQQIIKQPSALFSSPQFWDTIKPYFFDGLQQLKAPRMDHATVTDSWLNWDKAEMYLSFAFLPDALLVVYD